MTLNRYAYTENNPLMYQDPSGHWSIRGLWNSVKSAVRHVYKKYVAPVYKRYVAPVYKRYIAPKVNRFKRDVKHRVRKYVRKARRAYRRAKRWAERKIAAHKKKSRSKHVTRSKKQNQKPKSKHKNYAKQKASQVKNYNKSGCDGKSKINPLQWINNYIIKPTANFVAGVGVSLIRDIGLDPLIDGIVLIGATGERFGIAPKGTAQRAYDDLKQREKMMEEDIENRFVTNKKAYYAGRVKGDEISKIVGLASTAAGLANTAVGVGLMGGGAVTAQTVIGPIVLGSAGAATAAVGVAQTAYGASVSYNSFKNGRENMLKYSSAKGTDNAIKRQGVDSLPDNAKMAYKNYNDSGWKGNIPGQTPGTKAGSTFKNSDRKLPTTDSTGNPITYKEFDVNNKVAGQGRDAERFVQGSDGSTYYTKDHYDTFTKIE